MRKFNFTTRQIFNALFDSHSSFCCFYILQLVHLVVWPLYLIAELKLHHDDWYVGYGKVADHLRLCV